MVDKIIYDIFKGYIELNFALLKFLGTFEVISGIFTYKFGLVEVLRYFSCFDRVDRTNSYQQHIVHLVKVDHWWMSSVEGYHHVDDDYDFTCEMTKAESLMLHFKIT